MWPPGQPESTEKTVKPIYSTIASVLTILPCRTKVPASGKSEFFIPSLILLETNYFRIKLWVRWKDL